VSYEEEPGVFRAVSRRPTIEKRVYEPSVTSHYLRLLGLDLALAIAVFALGLRFSEDLGALHSLVLGTGGVIFLIALLPIVSEMGTRIEIYKDRIIYRRGVLRYEFTWDRLDVFDPDHWKAMGFRYCYAAGRDRAGNKKSFTINSLMFKEYDQLTSLVVVAKKCSWQGYMDQLNISRKEMLVNPGLTNIDKEVRITEG